jgi:hypothetical protein
MTREKQTRCLRIKLKKIKNNPSQLELTRQTTRIPLYKANQKNYEA